MKRFTTFIALLLIVLSTTTNTYAIKPVEDNTSIILRSPMCCDKSGMNSYYEYTTHNRTSIPGSRLNCEVSVYEKATCIGCGAVKSRTLIERYHHQH